MQLDHVFDKLVLRVIDIVLLVRMMERFTALSLRAIRIGCHFE